MLIDQERIHAQCLNDDPKERMQAKTQLVNKFSSLPDKQQAWKDLIRLTNDEDSDVIFEAVYGLRYVFPHVPDKQQAWNDLHRMTYDKDIWVRSGAAYSLASAFSHVTDKQQAWEDLHRLTLDENSDVTAEAADTLGFVFPQVPDKQQAWNDLHRLINDEDNWVRWKAATSVKYAYSYITDKQEAWNDLHRLITEKDSNLRSAVAYFLVSSFSKVPDKQQVWDDLIKLTSDEDSHVRSKATVALGSVFSHVSDEQKQQAWSDLHKLTNDKDISVRIYANYSLGKASIFNTSQAETNEDYKKELENAIEFFEKATKESFNKWDNPSKFCLPFYRSFHSIVFKKQVAKEEVDKYLAEAKNAIQGSKSKELLFEAVENLANALNEVQNLENLDLEAKKGELNFYRKYCERAAELMIDAEETAPFATITLRKGLPILDRNIKSILEEIQEKAQSTYRQSKGTVTEEIAYSVCREVHKWEIGGQKEMTQKVEDIAYLLKMKVADIPENKYLLNKIEAIKHERNLVKQYDALLFVIGQIPTVKVVSEQELNQKLDQKLQKFDLIFDEITCIKDKLSCISFDISKIKLNSADVISYLKSMKEELEIVCKIEGLNTLSIEKLDSVQFEKLNGLNNDILERLDEIKILICELSKDNDELYQEYSKRLDKLKQSKLDTLLQRYSAAISLISFAISGIQIAR